MITYFNVNYDVDYISDLKILAVNCYIYVLRNGILTPTSFHLIKICRILYNITLTIQLKHYGGYEGSIVCKTVFAAKTS